MIANTTAFGGKDIAQAVSGFLKAVNIDTDIQIHEAANWVQESGSDASKRPGMFVQFLNWDPTYEAGQAWRWYIQKITPPAAGLRWTDPKFEEMVTPGLVEIDDQKRAQIFQNAAQYLHDQAPMLFLWRYQRPGNTRKGVTWKGGFFADMYSASRLSKTE
jgi:ABC-type transport system substrate-binding protein